MRDSVGLADCQVWAYDAVYAKYRPGLVLLVVTGVFGIALSVAQLVVVVEGMGFVLRGGVWSVVYQDGQVTVCRLPSLSS